MSQPISINKVTSAPVNALILSFLNGKELACAARTQKVWNVLVDSRPDLVLRRIRAEREAQLQKAWSWRSIH